jgi:hypothetical protein
VHGLVAGGSSTIDLMMIYGLGYAMDIARTDQAIRIIGV